MQYSILKERYELLKNERKELYKDNDRLCNELKQKNKKIEKLEKENIELLYLLDVKLGEIK